MEKNDKVTSVPELAATSTSTKAIKVKMDGTPVRNKPEKGPDVMTYVGLNDKLEELEKKDGWVKVKIITDTQAREGWIRKECIA